MPHPIKSTLFSLLFAGLLSAAATHAAPRIPTDGAQVIERLPNPSNPEQRELKRMRAELAARPGDPRVASQLARRYIAQARSNGDPRYLGYAQAALAPWWSQPRAPAEIMLLRATLLQSTHQFPQALQDLDAVLRADRSHAQAWLTRATVLAVQGEFAKSRASCERLAALAPELVTQACLASVASLTGNAARGYAQLRQALDRDQQADPDLKLWAHTLLADMAARSGDAPAAEGHFRQALALDRADSYLLGAYADFLIDQKRPSEVVNLLKDSTRIDALLLRYALALQATNAPAAKAETENLRTRFQAAMLRGDTVHQREQARFALWLERDPEAALTLAQANWAVQKEPADLRILLEAAAAAHDRAAAQPALAWLKSTGLEDRALAPVLAKFERGN